MVEILTKEFILMAGTVDVVSMAQSRLQTSPLCWQVREHGVGVAGSGPVLCAPSTTNIPARTVPPPG